MNARVRICAISMIVAVGLCGCKSMNPVASSLLQRIGMHVFFPKHPPEPVVPPTTTLDAYKVQVAQRVMMSNRSKTFSGKLPEMLPAIVVLRITVDKNGELKDVWVQRSRDEEASLVALDSMRRSRPLPRPTGTLLAQNSNSLSFSETFLFNEDYRFQLRSMAGPQ